jgi:hypothetical protein
MHNQPVNLLQMEWGVPAAYCSGVTHAVASGERHDLAPWWRLRVERAAEGAVLARVEVCHRRRWQHGEQQQPGHRDCRRHLRDCRRHLHGDAAAAPAGSRGLMLLPRINCLFKIQLLHNLISVKGVQGGSNLDPPQQVRESCAGGEEARYSFVLKVTY